MDELVNEFIEMMNRQISNIFDTLGMDDVGYSTIAEKLEAIHEEIKFLKNNQKPLPTPEEIEAEANTFNVGDRVLVKTTVFLRKRDNVVGHGAINSNNEGTIILLDGQRHPTYINENPSTNLYLVEFDNGYRAFIGTNNLRKV